MIEIDIEKKMRTYDGYRLLKVRAAIGANSIVKVTGPSGSGKTTLLKVIAGLMEPEEGKITVNNVVWHDSATGISLPPQKRRTGFVFQDYALFPNMTIKQHLQYTTDDADWIDELLHFAKLETLADHKPLYLSGGQQQRLGIVRAMAIKPQLMLMDEPFSALDQDMRKGMIPQLKILLQKMNTTCLIVTHNPLELTDIVDSSIDIT